MDEIPAVYIHAEYPLKSLRRNAFPSVSSRVTETVNMLITHEPHHTGVTKSSQKPTTRAFVGQESGNCVTVTRGDSIRCVPNETSGYR